MNEDKLFFIDEDDRTKLHVSYKTDRYPEKAQIGETVTEKDGSGKTPVRLFNYLLTYASSQLRSLIAVGYNPRIKSSIVLEVVLFFTRGPKGYFFRLFLFCVCAPITHDAAMAEN